MTSGLRKLHGAVLLAALSRPSLSLAADTEPIRIEYHAEADAGCPSQADFAQLVFARTGAARPASESEAARTFVVELKRTATRVAGTLTIEETRGASMARRVSGSECGHVASVLALAIALAIDPRAELAPSQELDPARPPAAPPADTSRPAPTQHADSSTLRERAEDDAWSPRVSLGASAAFGIAPYPSFGPAAGLGLRHGRALLLRELGLAFVFRTGASALIRDATADFHFLTARAMLCARGVQIAESLHAGPCFAFEAGVVRASGSDLPVTGRTTRFWAAAEGLIQLEQTLPAGFFVTLEGGAALPVTRYRFVFRSPDTPVHDVPLLTAQLGLRLGVGF
ncbi:MAG TPA: hypothetical protein VIW29_21915 [Polyangiaceae bacterium]